MISQIAFDVNEIFMLIQFSFLSALSTKLVCKVANP
jgi:hypothetical protein